MARVIAIAAAVVLVALIAAWVAIYFRRRRSQDTAQDHGWALKGDLTARQEHAIVAENEAAADLLRLLLTPPSNLDDDMTMLARGHRMSIEAWLERHASTRRGLPQ